MMIYVGEAVSTCKSFSLLTFLAYQVALTYGLQPLGRTHFLPGILKPMDHQCPVQSCLPPQDFIKCPWYTPRPQKASQFGTIC